MSAKPQLFWDLDGTLIDVSERHYQVYSKTVKALGGSPLTKESYWAAKRRRISRPALIALSHLQPDVERAYDEAFIRHIELLSYLRLDALLPSAQAVLGELSREYRCYVVSMRHRRVNLVKELEWLGLAGYFIKVLSGHPGGDAVSTKTALVASQRDSVGGAIIGDSEVDIECGLRLGLQTIGVSTGIRSPKVLAPLQADALLAGLEMIPAFLTHRCLELFRSPDRAPNAARGRRSSVISAPDRCGGISGR